MAEPLVGLSCSEFASALAARRPMPGGGGAAALAGALAAALCSMAGEFTVGKPRFADVEDDVRRMLEEAARLRGRLVELVDEDAVGFEPLHLAYALPKDDPTRDARIEEATKGACEAPLAMMRSCARTVELLEEMGQKCSCLLLPDVGCGAALAASALKAASMNVYANTALLRDRVAAEQIECEADDLIGTYVARADALAEAIAARVRGSQHG